MGKIIIHKCNFDNRRHKKVFRELLTAYMVDSMGNATAPGEEHLNNVVRKIKEIPHCYVFLAQVKDRYVGMAVCFSGFSTFKARKLINIHDLIVLKDHRRLGIGEALLKSVEKFAIEQECCKITLEVREDNRNAIRLYNKSGFTEESPPMRFQVKYLKI